ncbi:uncharacterized protein LOC127844968 [Dreissena polymorpha]|uniref:Uncharacterized protein n=1 Tax=Dreissena polymorpha TaxID=45954 RepID=A0A9D4IKH6_DREPO|nr:uncharacterized protein LOC127844968 [Dreissena polymorpha]KAH3778986.1 hypothetical protein DPMN_180465 [Dreissena polymorpha]
MAVRLLFQYAVLFVGLANVRANCPMCTHFAFGVAHAPKGYVEFIRPSLDNVLKNLNTCNGVDAKVCSHRTICTTYYALMHGKGQKNVDPDIEISVELIIRGCQERSSSDVDRCIPVGDTISPANPMVNGIFAVYDHFSMNARSCISEQPMQFKLAIPESYVTTGSAPNGAPYVSAFVQNTFLFGIFLTLSLN